MRRWSILLAWAASLYLATQVWPPSMPIGSRHGGRAPGLLAGDAWASVPARSKSKTRRKKVAERQEEARRAAARKGTAAKPLNIQSAESKPATQQETGPATQQMPLPAILDEPPVGQGHIRIQHILIGFRGTVTHHSVKRTREEANRLAHQLLDRAQKGESFGHLVHEFSDDRDPGIYTIADRGASLAAGDYPRDAFAEDWGDACFELQIGQVSIIEYDPDKLVGWHIIKRLQ